MAEILFGLGVVKVVTVAWVVIFTPQENKEKSEEMAEPEQIYENEYTEYTRPKGDDLDVSDRTYDNDDGVVRLVCDRFPRIYFSLRFRVARFFVAGA